MINAITSALSGLTTATKQVEESAQNIAQNATGNAGSDNDVGAQGSVIEDIVDIKVAETAYKANIETIKTTTEINEELLRLFDELV
jgi:flagellar basal body rod protein FlgC